MTSPFGQPSFADIVQQLDELRKQVVAPITLEDLPIKDLRSKLIDNGEPLDLSVLALSATVQKSMLATDALNAFLKLMVSANRKLAFGAGAAVTWAFTASATSAAQTIQHGLLDDAGNGVQPQLVLLQQYLGPVAGFSASVTALTTTTFTTQASIAAATTGNIFGFWLAIG